LWTTHMYIHIHIAYPLKFTISFHSFSPFLWWYFFRSSILPTHIFFFFSSNICAWINNNANILYVWFKTILKVCFITCIAVLPRP
jgi:hypothetical protein